MNVLLVWSLEAIESPRLITDDRQVIDLVKTDAERWIDYLPVA
jgi:hypothetical protein